MENEIMSVRNEEPETSLNIMNESSIETVIDRAEKQVSILKKVLGIAVTRTNKTDWLNISGKPYLTATGAEKLMPLFGINITNVKSDKSYTTDDAGQYYLYTVSAKISWKGGSIETFGSCTSRDKFFAWESSTQTFKVLSQVDETNIMKSAYSNMLQRGISQLLGIRNLSWNELKQYGISQNDTQSITYGASKKEATDDEKLLQTEVRNMILEMSAGNSKMSREHLEAVTAFKGKDGNIVKGVSQVQQLTSKRLQIAHNNISTSYKKWKELSETLEDKNLNQLFSEEVKESEDQAND